MDKNNRNADENTVTHPTISKIGRVLTSNKDVNCDLEIAVSQRVRFFGAAEPQPKYFSPQTAISNQWQTYLHPHPISMRLLNLIGWLYGGCVNDRDCLG